MKVLVLATGIAAALVAGGAQAATYVVQAKALAFDQALAQKMEANGGQVLRRFPQIGVAIVEADDGFGSRAARVPGIRSAVKDISLQFDIPEAISRDFQETASNPPTSGDDDFYFDLQWGHDAIDAVEAWNRGFRGAGATVAILDSGLDCDHPDMVPNNLAGLNASFVPGEAVCTLPGGFNHGTHVAGTVAAADNAFGTIGVAPDADYFSVKVLSAFTGSGSFDSIISGITYAADAGADVINMSLGVRGGLPLNQDTNELVHAVTRAVQYARSQNATVIASASWASRLRSTACWPCLPRRRSAGPWTRRRTWTSPRPTPATGGGSFIWPRRAAMTCIRPTKAAWWPASPSPATCSTTSSAPPTTVGHGPAAPAWRLPMSQAWRPC